MGEDGIRSGRSGNEEAEKGSSHGIGEGVGRIECSNGIHTSHGAARCSPCIFSQCVSPASVPDVKVMGPCGLGRTAP